MARTKKTRKATESAPQAYARNATDIAALLQILSARLGGVADGDCRNANWAHVGTLAHVRESLAQIAAGLDIREDGCEDAAHARLEREIAEVR